MSSNNKGYCYIISAPSGSGKTTLIHSIMNEIERLHFVTSYTTRSARQGEVDGKDYHFVTKSRFQEMIDQDLLLEWAEVHGQYYGTPRESVEQTIRSGEDVVLEIDVQGAETVRRKLPEAVSIYILPSNPETIHTRLVERGKENEEAIRMRLSTARREIAALDQYDFLVVNDDLDEACRELRSIITAQRCRPQLRGDLVQRWQLWAQGVDK